MEPSVKTKQLVAVLSLILSIFVGYSEADTESISRCPSTIFRRVSSSEGSVAVTWDQPDCGVNPDSTHVNGEEFPQGVHTVIFWFHSDQSRRCCSFDIVVSGPDFDLCTQNTCDERDVCVAGLDHYFCHPGEIVVHQCSSLVIIRQSDGNNEPIANWTEPIALDYEGGVIEPHMVTPSFDQGDEITFPVHEITYEFQYRPKTSSRMTFTASCVIEINVAKEIGPGIKSCPRDIRVVSSQSSVKVDWLEPQLQPNEDPSTIMTSQTHSPGQMFNVPSRVRVTYNYTLMDNGRTTSCTFLVETARQDNSATVQSRTSHGDFFLVRPSDQNITWPRPHLSVTNRNNFNGSVVVFPSRVQPRESVYPKGFYPVTYIFKNNEGQEIGSHEFVIVYQSNLPDDITVTCVDVTRIYTESPSQMPLWKVQWDIPVQIVGKDADLAWINISHDQPQYLPVGTNLDVTYVVYSPSGVPQPLAVCNVSMLVREIPESMGTFTNDVIIAIVVTAVATLITSSAGFIFCLCCCTCCCTLEEKVHKVPAPPGIKGSGEAGRTTIDVSSRDPLGSAGRTRCVVKLPLVGKVPIYGPVAPTSRAERDSPSPTRDDNFSYSNEPDFGDSYGFDSPPENKGGRRTPPPPPPPPVHRMY